MRSFIFFIICHLFSCSGPYWEGKGRKKAPADSNSGEIDFLNLSFSENCKDSSDPEIKKTVEALLSIAEEKDCEIAEIELSKALMFDLSGKSLQNLEPLTGFKNLKRLYLDQNQLTNVSVLGSLENLELLSLRENQVTDITPLQDLAQLRWLFIGKNPLDDELPLANFLALQSVWLGSDTEPKVLQFKGPSEVESLEGPTAVCQAGYQYHEFNSCRSSTHPPESFIEKQSPHCGIQSKSPVYKSCRTRANGIESQARQETKTFFIGYIDENQIDYFRSKFKQECEEFTNTFKSSETDVQVNPREQINKTGELGRKRSFAYDCQVSVALFRSSPHADCGLDHEDIIYNMCAHPEHGVKEYQMLATAACGISDRLIQSKPNVEKVEVEALGQVGQCLSCDDLPSVSKEEAATLAQCLVDATQTVGPEFINESMKRFEETQLHKLSEAKALEFARSLDFASKISNL